MISRAEIDILYPENFKIEKKTGNIQVELPVFRKVPCSAYEFCKEQLDSVFAEIGNCKPEYIFVFGQLKQGKINFDDPFIIYTDEDCPVEDELLKKNDEVCSEEYCAQILLPYCDVYFPDSPVYQFLSNETSPVSEQFMLKLKEKYPSSLFFISEFHPVD